MVDRAFIGTWKIIGSSLNSYERNTVSDDDLKGVTFTLTERGDVIWVVPERLESVPLFNCDTYEYHIRTGGIKIGSFVDLRFGTYAGLIFEFNVLVIDPEKQIILKKEELYDLNCIRMDDTLNLNVCDEPFTLLSALEEGYFCDVTLTASNNKKFPVHSTILQMLGSDIDWFSDPGPFDRQPEEVLGTILHYLYAECLPENLSEEAANKVVIAVSGYASLGNLVDLCEKYVKRMQLKNPIIKFVLLCDIFTKNENNLTSVEQDEIMLLLKSKVPIYNSLFRRFLEGLKKIYRTMSPNQRIDVACFIVPEIDATLEAVIAILQNADETLQHMIHGFGAETSQIPAESEDNIKMSAHLIKLVHRTEFNKLISIHENIKVILEALAHKKEHFLLMTAAEQVQVVARNLDFFIKELPIFLIRLDEIVDVFDEKLELHEFKFFFKAETSKINYILEKLRENVETVKACQDGLLHFCDLMQRDSFNQALHQLGLIPGVSSSSQPTSEPDKSGQGVSGDKASDDTDKNLNLVKSLCHPPRLHRSELSKKCLELLNSQKNTDMEFEVLYNSTSYSDYTKVTDIKVNEMSENTKLTETDSDSREAEQSKELQTGDKSSEKTVIKAHRVVVASRCDWFRRALQSGMREAIDKKILIPDTNPALFKLFLEYLYTGQLDGILLSSDNLLELLLLSDRYEMDSLKQVCESYLKPSVDSESALYFLSIADQYNAHILKSKCISFITQNKYEITDTEEFYDLPISLQTEIFDTIWTQPQSKSYKPWSTFYSSDSTQAQSREAFQKEDPPDSSRLEQCLASLRNIIGDVPNRSYLVKLILAADYNLTRAVNFYYSDGNS